MQNAGSVFIGRWSSQPMGDYVSGPNHTLPTGGVARVRGGLSVMDFVKADHGAGIHAGRVAEAGTSRHALAEAEGLQRPCGRDRCGSREDRVAETVLQRAPAPRAAVQRDEGVSSAAGGRDGLRLDFNENTLACSPRVLEVLAQITAADLTSYPEREPVEAQGGRASGAEAGTGAADQRRG